MAGSIYLMQQDGTLSAMNHAAPENEDLLQTLVEKYPALLAGEQIDGDSPRRWLLVKREMGVGDSDDGGARWSLDHLFLDQDGIPTLVEVKRGADTRIRREVVGQMLDYAANAVLYWPLEKIKAKFEWTCKEAGQAPEVVLADFLKVGAPAGDGDPQAADAFWTNVKTNLAAERIRLVFVADEIPSELRRIVEFLNGQMDPAQVLAVEIKEYGNGQQRALVPLVMGNTAKAEAAKSASITQRGHWDVSSFLAAIKEQANDKGATVAKELIDWISPIAKTGWGAGKIDGRFFARAPEKINGKTAYLFEIWTMGEVRVWPDETNRVAGDAAMVKQWQDRLDRIPGIDFKAGKEGVCWIGPTGTLADPKHMAEFKAAMEWFMEQLRLKTVHANVP